MALKHTWNYQHDCIDIATALGFERKEWKSFLGECQHLATDLHTRGATMSQVIERISRYCDGDVDKGVLISMLFERARLQSREDGSNSNEAVRVKGGM